MFQYWNTLIFENRQFSRGFELFAFFVHLNDYTPKSTVSMMKICNRNATASVSRITYLSSIYHNTHTRKGGLLLHRLPLCRWSRILLLNFCNSIDNPQGNQCRAWSIIIVQYTFTTSHRLKIFRPVCMELSMTYKNRAVCLSILIISNQFDRISCSEKVLPKIFIIPFLIDKICASAEFTKKKRAIAYSNSSDNRIYL